MAWYAIYKWSRAFRKRPFEVNWTSWYSDKLYNEWFDSLSDEDKEKVIAYKEAKKKKDKERAVRILLSLGQIMTFMYSDSLI